MLLALQERLKTLIEADTYFEGVAILTEQLGNILAAYQEAIDKLGFCIVIEVSAGESIERSPVGPAFRELFTISISQGVLTDDQAATRNVVDGLEHAVLAIHGQPADAGDPDGLTFLVRNHWAGRTDGGEAVQQLSVEVVHAVSVPAEVP